MYDPVTRKAQCSRCNYSWLTRGSIPKVCPSCTSKLWNSGARKFEVIIARSCGIDESGRTRLCTIPYVDRPGIQTDDFFYLNQEDKEKYLNRARHPDGSALVFIGSFEIGEDLELKVHEMKLIYCHSPGFREYLTDASCLYNIKSYYERLKAQKFREAEAERLAAIKAEKERQVLEAARARIEEEAQRELQIEQAKKTIADESATTEERLRAARLLEHAA